jgi:hypothetical protein
MTHYLNYPQFFFHLVFPSNFSCTFILQQPWSNDLFLDSHVYNADTMSTRYLIFETTIYHA